MTDHQTSSLDLQSFFPLYAKWGWACRHVDRQGPWYVGGQPSRVGDVVVARVEDVSNHTRIVEASGARRRIYPGDVVVGVLGHRYATDAFLGRADINEGRVDLLTNAGMMGQVVTRHRAMKEPTELTVLGSLVRVSTLKPLNLIEERFSAEARGSWLSKVVLVLGTGMNAGKTTSAAKLIRGLLSQGLDVAALKVTGSVSPSDRSELSDTGASYVADFSDYGFPSTYLLSLEELESLAFTMINHADARTPDVIVVEVADGVLQRETELLLRSLRGHVHGAVLAAPCALSAWAGCDFIERAGVPVLAVTGIISNAPLFGQELEFHAGREVVTSVDDGGALARAVAIATRPDGRRRAA